MVSKQRCRRRCPKMSLLNETRKWGGIQISSTSANIQRQLWAIHIRMLLKKMMMMLLLILRLWNNKWRSHGTKASCSGFRHNSNASTRCYRAWMCVLAFIGCDHNWRIIGGTLNSLLYTTSSSGATVIAPIKLRETHYLCLKKSKLKQNLMELLVLVRSHLMKHW